MINEFNKAMQSIMKETGEVSIQKAIDKKFIMLGKEVGKDSHDSEIFRILKKDEKDLTEKDKAKLLKIMDDLAKELLPSEKENDIAKQVEKKLKKMGLKKGSKEYDSNFIRLFDEERN